MEDWQTWVVAGVILLIFEIFTPGFVTACFGIGCLVAGLASYLGFGYIVQIIIFCAVSLGLFFTIRPFVKKHLYKTSESIKTNTDALIGLVGLVDETIDPATDSGRVIVGGDNWRAISFNNVLIEKGKKVVVKKVERTKVFVSLVE
jgi:membrane protein implicated in regulation of membrane protease activity